MIDQVTLKEPVSLEDMLDQEEYTNSMLEVQKMLFERVRFQYGGHTWISDELWQIYCIFQHGAERLSKLRATGAFPKTTNG